MTKTLNFKIQELLELHYLHKRDNLYHGILIGNTAINQDSANILNILQSNIESYTDEIKLSFSSIEDFIVSRIGALESRDENIINKIFENIPELSSIYSKAYLPKVFMFQNIPIVLVKTNRFDFIPKILIREKLNSLKNELQLNEAPNFKFTTSKELSTSKIDAIQSSFRYAFNKEKLNHNEKIMLANKYIEKLTGIKISLSDKARKQETKVEEIGDSFANSFAKNLRGSKKPVADLETKKTVAAPESKTIEPNEIGDSFEKEFENNLRSRAPYKASKTVVDSKTTITEPIKDSLKLSSTQFNTKNIATENGLTDSSYNIKISDLASAAQFGLRHSGIPKAFLKLFGIEIPKIEISAEHSAIYDAGLNALQANNFADLKSKMINSAVYYAVQKNIELVELGYTRVKSHDYYKLTHVCIPYVINGALIGFVSGTPVIGSISGGAQCLAKYNFTKSENTAQTYARYGIDLLVGTYSLYSFDTYAMAKSTINLMSNVVLSDSLTAAYSGLLMSGDGILSDMYNQIFS